MSVAAFTQQLLGVVHAEQIRVKRHGCRSSISSMACRTVTLGTKTVLFSPSLVFGDVGLQWVLAEPMFYRGTAVCMSVACDDGVYEWLVCKSAQALGATAAPTLRRPGLQSLQARLVCSADLQRSSPRPSRLSALDFDENGGRDCYECQDRC